MRKTVVATLLLLAATGVQAASQPAEIYQYTDEKGIKVWSEYIPSDLVANGYRVFSATGILLYEVPSVQEQMALANMPTPEELEQQARVMEQQQASETEELDREQQIDDMLRRRYRSLEDYSFRRELSLVTMEHRKHSLKLRIDEVEAERQLVDFQVFKAEKYSGLPSQQVLIRQANLEDRKQQLSDDMQAMNDEISLYIAQTEMEYGRLRRLMEDS